MAELMESVSSDVSQILSAALAGEDITVDDACVLLDAKELTTIPLLPLPMN